MALPWYRVHTVVLNDPEISAQHISANNGLFSLSHLIRQILF
jgi:hypothetical protein